MSQEQPLICFWCDTEIVWDEELGPEEVCPHCLNELVDDHSSIALSLNLSGEEDNEEAERRSKQVKLELTASEAIVKLGVTEVSEEEVDQEDDDRESPTDYGDLHEYHKELLMCTSCGNDMLLCGTQIVQANAFIPQAAAGLDQPHLAAPFQVNLYVCPACYKMESILSEKDRDGLIRNLQS